MSGDAIPCYIWLNCIWLTLYGIVFVYNFCSCHNSSRASFPYPAWTCKCNPGKQKLFIDGGTWVRFHLAQHYKSTGSAPSLQCQVCPLRLRAGRDHHQEATDKALAQAFLCQTSNREEQTVLLTFHSPASQAQSREKCLSVPTIVWSLVTVINHEMATCYPWTVV